MISARPFIVGIGGTLRLNSSSECALKISLRAAEYHGAETLLITGRELFIADVRAGCRSYGRRGANRRRPPQTRWRDRLVTGLSRLSLRPPQERVGLCRGVRTRERTSTEWPSAAFLVQAAGRRADRHWLPCAQSSMRFAAGAHPLASRSTHPPSYLMKTRTASILQ
jgi:hypothetical protein